MAFEIPKPLASFNQPTQPLPSRTYIEPREGKFVIPVEIRWPGIAVAASYSVNIQGITTQTFSQIVMIDVDNASSGADVTFAFADTQDVLVVSGGSGGLFPVFTQQLSMYVSAPQALATDVTRFRVLNYRQEPIALPPPQFLQLASALNINGAATTAIVAAGIAGTLTGYNAFGAFTGVVAGTATVSLVDHATGAVIDQARVLATAVGVDYNVPLFNVSGASIRFSSGLDLVTAQSGGTPMFVNAVVRYRTP